MKDMFSNMYGRVEVQVVDKNGKVVDKIDIGKNAITYRAKTIMSRLLGGGLAGALDPSTGLSFNWGSTPTAGALRVTGMAFGNGGHLIYRAADNSVTNLPKSSGVILDSGLISADTTQPAMPFISGSNWGYASNAGQQVPGATYEHVENGNVPWDGTSSILDNSLGVTEVGSTLYSETFRVPLDTFGPDNDGIRFISKTEVQFKATLPLDYLNDTSVWGYAQQPANLISEAGLIIGYCPDSAISGGGKTITNGQLYSDDGNEPAAGNFASPPTSKDERPTAAPFIWGTKPTSSLSPDAWSGTQNNWNLFSRKTFPALTKSDKFSLVFLWTIGF